MAQNQICLVLSHASPLYETHASQSKLDFAVFAFNGSRFLWIGTGC